jgi:hypothetical protein
MFTDSLFDCTPTFNRMQENFARLIYENIIVTNTSCPQPVLEYPHFLKDIYPNMKKASLRKSFVVNHSITEGS